jgi:hypothetical protein
MPIPAAIKTAFAPWGNAELSFEVSGGVLATDPETGDPVTAGETLDYLANVKLSRPNWLKGQGADESLYECSGRLLHPKEFDRRITNGATAEAVISGYEGRVELRYELLMDPTVAPDIGRSFSGTFRVVGLGAVEATS